MNWNPRKMETDHFSRKLFPAGTRTIELIAASICFMISLVIIFSWVKWRGRQYRCHNRLLETSALSQLISRGQGCLLLFLVMIENGWLYRRPPGPGIVLRDQWDRSGAKKYPRFLHKKSGWSQRWLVLPILFFGIMKLIKRLITCTNKKTKIQSEDDSNIWWKEILPI